MSTSHIAFPPIGTYWDDEVVPKGTIHRETEGQRAWMFVQFKDAVTYVRGHVCSFKDTDGFTVTNDESGGNDVPAGVLPTQQRTETAVVPTEDQYGWLQFEGLHPAVAKAAADDSIADGHALIMHASTDGVAASAANTAAPAAADRARMIGRAAGASEDGASGTYDEDTVPVMLRIGIG